MLVPTKPWYKSKTLWVNVLGGVAVVLKYIGTINIGMEWVAGVLVVVNFFLRYLTVQPITFTGTLKKSISDSIRGG